MRWRSTRWSACSAGMSGRAAAEVGQVSPRRHHGGSLVRDEQIHHSVRHLDRHRPDIVRGDDAEPAALDHGRPAHAQAGLRRRDDHVAGAGQRRVAGEAVAGHHGDQRDQARQRGGQPEGRHVEPAHRGGVGVAGPPAAALGEHDQGQPLPADQLEQPVGLAVVHVTLGAGQHRVVVGHHRDRPAVDRRGAQDQAVGRGAGDEVVERAAAALRRDGQRAVLGEAARVGQVGDVLPGRPPPGGVPPLRHLGPPLVQPDPVPLPRLREVRSDVIQRDVLGLRLPGGIGPGLGQHDQHRPGRHRDAHRRGHLAHQARGLRPYLVLHLHRLDDEQFVARGDRVAGLDRDRHHGPGQRRAHRGFAAR